jgi:hypothetical protein
MSSKIKERRKMSKFIKPVLGVYADEKGGTYLQLQKVDPSEDETDSIDITHTDDESDGSDETYLPTDEDFSEEFDEEFDEDESDEEPTSKRRK